MFFNAFSAFMFQSVASNLWLILTELKKKKNFIWIKSSYSIESTFVDTGN